eukprot:UN0649
MQLHPRRLFCTRHKRRSCSAHSQPLACKRRPAQSQDLSALQARETPGPNTVHKGKSKRSSVQFNAAACCIVSASLWREKVRHKAALLWHGEQRCLHLLGILVQERRDDDGHVWPLLQHGGEFLSLRLEVRFSSFAIPAHSPGTEFQVAEEEPAVVGALQPTEHPLSSIDGGHQLLITHLEWTCVARLYLLSLAGLPPLLLAHIHLIRGKLGRFKLLRLLLLLVWLRTWLLFLSDSQGP